MRISDPKLQSVSFGNQAGAQIRASAAFSSGCICSIVPSKNFNSYGSIRRSRALKATTQANAYLRVSEKTARAARKAEFSLWFCSQTKRRKRCKFTTLLAADDEHWWLLPVVLVEEIYCVHVVNMPFLGFRRLPTCKYSFSRFLLHVPLFPPNQRLHFPAHLFQFFLLTAVFPLPASYPSPLQTPALGCSAYY